MPRKPSNVFQSNLNSTQYSNKDFIIQTKLASEAIHSKYNLVPTSSKGDMYDKYLKTWLKIKEEPRFQGLFSDLLGLTTASNAVNNVANSIEHSNSTFSRMVDASEPFLKSVTETLNKLNGGFTSATMAGLFALLFSLWRSRHDRVTFISILLSHGLMKIGTPAYSFFVEKIKSLTTKKPSFQIGPDPQFTIPDIEVMATKITKYFPLFSTIALIFIAPFLKSGPVNFSQYFSNMTTFAIEKAGMIGRATGGIQTFYTSMSSLIEYSMKSILYTIFGIESVDQENVFNTRVKELLEQLIKMQDYENQHAALLDNKVLDRVQELVTESYRLCKDYECLKTKPSSQGSWDILKTVMEKSRLLHAKLVDVCAAKDKDRTAPLAVLIQGQTGIGKSYTSDYIIKLLAKYHNRLVEEGTIEGKLYDLDDLGDLKYTLNPSNEFYDGYKQQFSVVMDDFGQMKDSQAKPNVEFLELIRIVNEAQYPVHSAHLADKGKIYMRSNFVLATTNTLRHNITSITYPAALYRRFKYIVRLRVKPQYANPNGSLNLPALGGRMRTDIYDVEIMNGDAITNPNVHVQRKGVVSFKQFIQMIYVQYKDTFSRTQTYKTFMTDPANFNVDPDEQNTRLLPGFQMMGEDSDSDEEDFLDPDNEEIENVVQDSEYVWGENSPGAHFKNFRQSLLKDIRNYLPDATSYKYLLNNFTWFNINTNFQYLKNKLIENWKAITVSLVGILGIAALLFKFGGARKCKNCKLYDNSSKVERDAYNYYTHASATTGCDACKKVSMIDRSVPLDQLKFKVDRARLDETSFEGMFDEAGYKSLDKFTKNIINIKSSTGRVKARITMLKGRVGLLNAHVALHLKEQDEFKIEVFNSQEQTIKTKYCEFVLASSDDNTFNDYALIVLPQEISAFKDITTHICRKSDIQHFKETRAILINHVEKNKQVVKFGNVTASDVACDVAGKRIRNRYEYAMATQEGDCGSLLIAENPKITHKIIGIHALRLDSEKNAAICITWERIEALLDKIEPSFQIAIPELPSVIANTNELKHQEIVIENIRNLGTLKDNIPMPSKTSLIQSPLYGKIEHCPPTCKPAHLFNPGNDPLTMGLLKVANLPGAIDKEKLDKASDHFFEGEYVVRSQPAPVLTFEEGVSGNSELGVVPLCRSTSPGYPYICQQRKLPGKREWFGDSDYIYSDEIRKDVEKRIQNARVGIRTETIWIDTLKDERRPIEKVDANKTRVFSVGPQDYIIAVRMYFGAFVGHIMKNRVKNEICVGINAYSSEWTDLVYRLREVGTKVIAGDFSNFDGSLLLDILRNICIQINKWYSDGNDLIRITLFEEICNGIHSCRGHVYSWTHSQPSGNPLTVIINSIFNSIIMRLAFMEVGGSLMDYDKNIRMQNFGDDNLFSVSEEWIGKFNQVTITQALATFGLTYTDEGKSGEIVPYRSLNEVSFLKRGFRRLPCGTYRAPLALSTITEMCQWLRSSADPRNDCKENVEQALFELSAHDDTTWEKYSKLIISAARENNIHISNYDKLDWFNDRVKLYIDEPSFQMANETDNTHKQVHNYTDQTAKNGSIKEQITTISRQDGIHQDGEMYLRRCAPNQIQKASCSAGTNVTAFGFGKQRSVNKTIQMKNGKFVHLPQGTKAHGAYNVVSKSYTVVVKNSENQTVWAKTLAHVEKKDESQARERLMSKFFKWTENRQQLRSPKRDQRDKKVAWECGTISGDPNTKRVVQRALESISGDPTTKKVVNRALESLETSVETEVNPIARMVWFLMKTKASAFGCGFVRLFCWESLIKPQLESRLLYNIHGKDLTLDEIIREINTGQMDPWDSSLAKYLPSGKPYVAFVNYFMYISTAIIEEMIYRSDEKAMFGFFEFFLKVSSRPDSWSIYLPAMLMHLVTYGLSFPLRVLIHTVFNIFTVYQHRKGVENRETIMNAMQVVTQDQQANLADLRASLGVGTLENATPANTQIQATEEGSISGTSGDSNMTQLIQDQTIVSDKMIVTGRITTEKNDLGKTLQRRVLIGRYKLYDGLPQGQIMYTDVFPKAMIAASDFQQDRLQYYRYVRGSIKFTVMVNATKFDIGQLYLLWIPNGALDISGTFDKYNFKSLRAITSAVGVPLKIGPGTVGELKVPCLIPFKGYDTHADQYSFGSFKVAILNPLVSKSANPITFTIFAEWCEDVQVEVAMPKSATTRHLPVSPRDYAPGIEPGTLLESIAAVAGVVGPVAVAIASGIPLIGTIAGSISKMLKYFGWAKPLNVEVVRHYAQLPSKEVNHARGLDGSIVLGLDNQNCSDIHGKYCYRPVDEMTFPYLMRQRVLHEVIEWSYSSPEILTVIQSRPWDPIITTDATDIETADIDYIGFIANCFDLWTGEIEYQVEILNTIAQSGRIRVGIFPPMTDADAKALTIDDFDNVPNEVLDVQTNQTTFTFNAPFLVPSAWANVSTPGSTIVIAVLNDLNCQEGTPDTAYVNVWRRGTNSLQFTSPSMQSAYVPQWRDGVTPPARSDQDLENWEVESNSSDNSGIQNQEIFIGSDGEIDSGEEDSTSSFEDYYVPKTLTLQGKLKAAEDALISYPSGKFQYFVEEEDSKSFHQFKVTDDVLDANVDTFKSVKDLINRVGLVTESKTGKKFVSQTNVNLFGNLQDSSDQTDEYQPNSEKPTMLEYFSRLFAYCRGSINVKVFGHDTTQGVVYSSIRNNALPSSTQPEVADFFKSYSANTADIYRFLRFSSIHPLQINPICEINIPQFSHTPMRAVQYTGNVDTRIPLGPGFSNTTEARVLELDVLDSTQYNVMWGAGDDFQFCAPYGVPRLARVVRAGVIPQLT